MQELPKRKQTTQLTVKIDSTILDEVKQLCKLNGLTLTQIVEFGLKTYIEKVKEKV